MAPQVSSRRLRIHGEGPRHRHAEDDTTDARVAALTALPRASAAALAARLGVDPEVSTQPFAGGGQTFSDIEMALAAPAST